MTLTPKSLRHARVKRMTLAMLFSLIGSVALAQFTLSGEIRPRTEFRNGFKTLVSPNTDIALFTQQRSRLNFQYKAEQFSTGLVLQDIRTWGSTSQLNTTDAFSSVHEAWGTIHFSKGVALKMGRQELIYDNHRIFGSVAWAQQARSHDMARLMLKDSTNRLDIGLAFNQNGPSLSNNDYTIANNYKTIHYAWWHKDWNKQFSSSVLLLNNGLQGSETDTAGTTEYMVRYSQTAGTYLSYKKNALKANAQFYYQMGEDVGNNEIAAYDGMVEVLYTMKEKFTVGLGVEILSGTSQTDTANTTNNSFAPFYGTNHKFNGYMDYFYVGNHGNSVGLQDVYLKFGFKKGKIKTGLDLHGFMAAADVLDQEALLTDGTYTAMDPMLGMEADFTMKYTHAKGVAFQLGYSQMMATETLEALRGGDRNAYQGWAYLMISVKPVFFTTASAK